MRLRCIAERDTGCNTMTCSTECTSASRGVVHAILHSLHSVTELLVRLIDDLLLIRIHQLRHRSGITTQRSETSTTLCSDLPIEIEARKLLESPPQMDDGVFLPARL